MWEEIRQRVRFLSSQLCGDKLNVNQSVSISSNFFFFRFQEITIKTGKGLSFKNKIFFHLPFSIVFVMQVIMAYLFWLAYGTLAFILGPLRTWSLILAAVLYWQSLNLPEKCTRWVEIATIYDLNDYENFLTEKLLKFGMFHRQALMLLRRTWIALQ